MLIPQVDDYLNNLPITSLPGIGHVLAEKLKNRHIQTCGQLRTISKVVKLLFWTLSSLLSINVEVDSIINGLSMHQGSRCCIFIPMFEELSVSI